MTESLTNLCRALQGNSRILETLGSEYPTRPMIDFEMALARSTGTMPNAAPNGGNKGPTRIHFTNDTLAWTTKEGVPAWTPDSAGMLG
jgi:hypothetical protein